MGDLRVDDEGEKSLTQERLASRRRAQEGEAFILAIGAKCWLKLKRNQQSRTITRRGRHTGAGTAHGRGDGIHAWRRPRTDSCVRGSLLGNTSPVPFERQAPTAAQAAYAMSVKPGQPQSLAEFVASGPPRGFTPDERRRRRRLDARPDFRPGARPDDWLAGSSPWSPRAQAR